MELSEGLIEKSVRRVNQGKSQTSGYWRQSPCPGAAVYEDIFLKTAGGDGKDKLCYPQNPLSCIFSSCSTEIETKIGVVVHAFKRGSIREAGVGGSL